MEPKIKDTDEASRLIVEIASMLIKTMQSKKNPWLRAFVRFEMGNSSKWGCNGSYETPIGVTLFDPFSDGKDLFAPVNHLGPRLRHAASTVEKEILVLIVVVDSDFNYKIDFESTDAGRWKISKLNGATGIPEGLS